MLKMKWPATIMIASMLFPKLTNLPKIDETHVSDSHAEIIAV